jgi:exodeoxyribonuclease VII small subunit
VRLHFWMRRAAICAKDGPGHLSIWAIRSIPIAPETKTASAEVAGLSFEAALGELETIVKRLEDGAVDLEDSIALYERGQTLKAHCEAKLKAAEGRLEKIVLGASGPESTVMVEGA